MQQNSDRFLPRTDPISHWKIVVQIVSPVHAPNSDLFPLKQIVGQTVMYNRTTNAFEVESWHHTTLRMAPCHREHGVAHSSHSISCVSLYAKMPSNDLQWSITKTSNRHSAWGWASQTLQGGRSLEQNWPYTRSWAKSRGWAPISEQTQRAVMLWDYLCMICWCNWLPLLPFVNEDCGLQCFNVCPNLCGFHCWQLEPW